MERFRTAPEGPRVIMIAYFLWGKIAVGLSGIERSGGKKNMKYLEEARKGRTLVLEWVAVTIKPFLFPSKAFLYQMIVNCLNETFRWVAAAAI